jgi:hypothetical protein
MQMVDKSLLPLNGTKTHKLTAFALRVLTVIKNEPIPVHEVNPGVRNRLEREMLVKTIKLPSPYKTHKQKEIPFYAITAAGLKVLENG